MSDTERDDEFKKWYSKESPWAKRFTRRVERRKGKDLLRSDDPEAAKHRQTKGTEGWITH